MYPIIDTIKNSLDHPNLIRGSLTVRERFYYIPGIAGIWGVLLGGYQGGKLEGLRYMVEHQHQLPKLVSEWYFYHKRKNYLMMLEGLKSGSKVSIKLMALCTIYEAVQWSSDVYGFGFTTNPISSGLAGFVTSSMFSTLAKLPKQSRKYAIIAGTGFGLFAGGLQNLIDTLKAHEKKPQEEKSQPDE